VSSKETGSLATVTLGATFPRGNGQLIRETRLSKNLLHDDRGHLTPETMEVDAERDRRRRGVARLFALFAWLSEVHEAPRRQSHCARRTYALDPGKNLRDRDSRKSSIEVSSEAVLAASSLFGTQRLQG
jgi:hypothetical protein